MDDKILVLLIQSGGLPFDRWLRETLTWAAIDFVVVEPVLEKISAALTKLNPSVVLIREGLMSEGGQPLAGMLGQNRACTAVITASRYRKSKPAGADLMIAESDFANPAALGRTLARLQAAAEEQLKAVSLV